MSQPPPPREPDRAPRTSGEDAPTQAFARPRADGAPNTGEPRTGEPSTVAMPAGARQEPPTAWSTAPAGSATPEPGRDDDAIGTPYEPVEPPPASPRGTLDLGLLLLRLALGVVLVGHGAQKLFAVFSGSGIDGFAELLTTAGYDQPELLAYVGAIAELGAGALIVLGLLTPLAAAAALGVTINAWLTADTAAPGFLFFVGNGGQEYELVLVSLAAVLILTGPGRYALDFRQKWATRPFLGSVVALLLGVGAGLAVWFLLNGTTPFA